MIEGLLALAVIIVWGRRLEPHLPFRMLALAIVLIVGGTATLVEPVTGLFHESWAALLMALMIGTETSRSRRRCDRRRRDSRC